jgi:pyrroline-5-carboxylate reductase
MESRATLNESLYNKTVGILGFGAMGSALASGLVQAGAVGADRILCADPQRHRLAASAEELGVRLTADNGEVVERADILVLAVKPHTMEAMLRGIGESLRPEQLVLSIAAGVRVAAIERHLPADVPVVRAMPNSCAQVNTGACAICAGTRATERHLQTASAVFSAVGSVITVSESMMDAVTALSGSGPAYVYLMIEALIDGGVKVGLPRDVAYRLTVQTVLGAATMALESGRHPAELKDMVATPSGTTIAALAALEQSGFRSALMTAVEKATERSRELGAP